MLIFLFQAFVRKMEERAKLALEQIREEKQAKKERKIRQEIVRKLDQIEKRLQATIGYGETPDVTSSDNEFTSWVAYLTERQKTEKKSLQFSPAQVFEQAAFEVYFRDSFGLREKGEISEISSETEENIPTSFSPTELIFKDKNRIRRKVTLKRVYDSPDAPDSERPKKQTRRKVTLKRVF